MELLAPTLLPYEVTNAILQAVKRNRISLDKGLEILAAFQGLGIPTMEVPWQRSLELAHTYERKASGKTAGSAPPLAKGHHRSRPVLVHSSRRACPAGRGDGSRTAAAKAATTAASPHVKLCD